MFQLYQWITVKHEDKGGDPPGEAQAVKSGSGYLGNILKVVWRPKEVVESLQIILA